jgi:hypothetical protein
MTSADREWIQQAAQVGYEAVLTAIREHPDQAVRDYCSRNRAWTTQIIIDAIVRAVTLRLAERDAEVVKAEGRLN